MTTPLPPTKSATGYTATAARYPGALEVATYAVARLEDDALFNSGHGAVFTRDGINELEASVMVSRGRAKRGVGVTGLRHVRNPIRLARALLEHGDADLAGKTDLGWAGRRQQPRNPEGANNDDGAQLDVPSAQGHTLLHGRTAEILAERYGLAMVEPAYFFTQARWDEHVRALEREKAHHASRSPGAADAGREPGTATWHPDEYLPQGTCGAVALDAEGVVCVATSTGGMTNKLTGRIGDTPSMGAGFWAEEWDDEQGDALRQQQQPEFWSSYLGRPGRAAFELSGRLRGLVADCLPSPFAYTPLSAPVSDHRSKIRTTRSAALSGTGNGDSFLRVAAVHTVVAMARWAGLPTAVALGRVAGPGGELQRSAGGRWGRTGEGEGGMIGVESVVERDAATGVVVAARSAVVQAHNCAGMFRAWIDDDGKHVMRIWDGHRDRALMGDR